MSKKIISVLLVIALIATMLAGCGKKKQGETVSSTEVESQQANTPKRHLTVWAWDKTFNIYAMEEAQKLYQSEHPDVELYIITCAWDDIKAQLNTIIESGDLTQLPDIFLIQDFAYQKYLQKCPEMFADLTNTGIAFNEFAEGKMGSSMMDGKNYGIPFDNGAEVAGYRTDVLEAAGYTIDDLTDITWERFIEIGKDVLAKTGHPLLSVQGSSMDIINQILQSAGKTIWNDDGSTNFTNNPELTESIKIYKELTNLGIMRRVESWDDYLSTFNSGDVCGVMNGCWILGYMQSAEDQAGKWKLTNMPKLSGFPDAVNYSNQGGSTWAIAGNCSDMDLAVDFMKNTFAGSKEFYDTILPKSGAIATWVPAGESDVYGQPHEFFENQTVFSLITEYAAKTPAVKFGVYYVETNDELAVAVQNIIDGGDIEKELQDAQQRIEQRIRDGI